MADDTPEGEAVPDAAMRAGNAAAPKPDTERAAAPRRDHDIAAQASGDGASGPDRSAGMAVEATEIPDAQISAPPFVLTEESLERALVALVAPFDPEPQLEAVTPSQPPYPGEPPAEAAAKPQGPAAEQTGMPDAEAPRSAPADAATIRSVMKPRSTGRFAPAALAASTCLLAIGLLSGIGLSTAAIDRSAAVAPPVEAARTPVLPLVAASPVPAADAPVLQETVVTAALGTDDLAAVSALAPGPAEQITARAETNREAPAPRAAAPARRTAQKTAGPGRPAVSVAARAAERGGSAGSVWDLLKRVVD